jgi:hypothetical protein
MNTIRFKFDDLCIFFSRYSSRLLVGMISTDGEAPEHIHKPHIIITRNGAPEREYHDWAEINGEILLEVLPEGKPLSRYKPKSRSDWRRPFSMLVDIDKDLHPNEKLNLNPMLCRARLYFKNGDLYSTNPFTNVRFADVKTGQSCGHAPAEMTVNVGLDVEIPEDGYARLRFFNGTEEFIFRSGSDYEVEIANRAPTISYEHSKYFYNIVDPKPERMWYLTAGEKPGLPAAAYGDRVTCLEQTSSLTVWEWLMGLLGGD